ncbi:MAG: hypothetical protein V7688_14715 [Alcanivorax jadensis]|uniref:hypothetical protein n=1 Tax=Alcanivorax jadensis TaxID=64988 RepID=UPI003003A35F
MNKLSPMIPLLLGTVFSTAQAGPYDHLPPEMRDEILSNMAEMEEDFQSVQEDGVNVFNRDNSEENAWIAGSTALPKNIDWVAGPPEGAELVSFMQGENGQLPAGVFGSAKSLSQLDNRYRSMLTVGWTRHAITDSEIIYLQGRAKPLTDRDVSMLMEILATTPHVAMSSLPDGAMMFDEEHISSLQISAK